MNFHLMKFYQCPECRADVEAAGGPDGVSRWRCRNCDWSKVYDEDADEYPVRDLPKREPARSATEYADCRGGTNRSVDTVRDHSGGEP